MKIKEKLFGLGAILLFGACNSTTHENDHQENELPNNTSEYVETDGSEKTFNYELLEDYALLDTRTKLYDAFDQSELKDDTTWMAEGTVQVVYSELNDPNTNNVVRFYWEDNQEDLYMVEVDYLLYDEYYTATDSQRVESECGIYTGMPLTEIVMLNGKDFNFLGFGWDYAGGVFFEEDDKLSKCNISIHLSYDYDAFSEDMGDLMGDQMVNTSEAVTKEVPIFIDRMSMIIGEMEF